MEHVLYVKNRLPHSPLNGKSPSKILTSRTPSYVCVLGYAAFVFSHHPKSKVHGKEVPAIHLDENDNGAYILECLGKKKLVSSVHVVFK